MEIWNRLEKRGKVSSTGRLSLTTGVEGSTKNHSPWWGDHWTDTLSAPTKQSFQVYKCLAGGVFQRNLERRLLGHCGAEKRPGKSEIENS